MALSGSFQYYPTTYLGLYCEWSGSQSIAGNYTDVTVDVYLKYYSLHVGARSDGYCTINGSTQTFSTPAINTDSNNNTKLLTSYTVRVYHDDDGTKSCGLSASWRFSGTYSGVSISRIEASATVTLNTIARASQPSCISYPNNTQNVGNMGNSIMIHMNRKSSVFTHTVTYAFGNTSGTIGTGVGDNISWTIPMSLANQIPSATSGTGTITVNTYNGGTYIGQKSVSFTCSVPASVVPTVNTLTASIINTNSVINEWNIAVAGYTKVKVTATASGAYGSSISSFTISGGYSTTQTVSSLSYTGGAISTSGNKIFYVTVKDSRGRTSTQATSNTITFYSYTEPVVSSISAERSSTDSTKMIVKVNWTYSTVNNHNITNAILKYKKSTQSAWSTYGAISKNTSETLTATFEEVSSYNFLVVVTDSLSNSAQNETFISTIEVLLDFRAGGKGLGIGKIAETDRMEVALDTVFMGNIAIKDGSTDIPLATYIRNIINGS